MLRHTTKKLIAISFALLFSVSFLSAASMRLYDYDSAEYKSVGKLCLISGVVGPSSATPVTESELLVATKRIDPNQLPARYRDEYDRLVVLFSENNDCFEFDFGLAGSAQFYLSPDFKTMPYDEFFIKHKDMDPFAMIKAELSYGSNIFMESSIELMNNSVILSKDRNGIPLTSSDFVVSMREGKLVSGKANEVEIFGEWPALARGAFGNKWFNIIIGRTRHQMGTGYSGNLIVGDNYKFQELLKLTTVSRPFTYSLDITHFDPQGTDKIIQKPNFSDKQVLRVIHRLDAVPVNRFRAVVNLGFLLYASNPMDIRLFTPLFVVHNWYNFSESKTVIQSDEANNILSVEFEYAVIPRLEINMQITVDQLQMLWERDDVPNALGFMLNVSYLQTFDRCDVKYYAEGVFNTANLYLNTKYNSDGTKNYNYDWAVGYFRRDTSGSIAWSGHPFGPNAVGGVIGAYTEFAEQNLTIDSSITYYANGDIGFEHDYFKDKIIGFRGTPEHKLFIKSIAEYTVFDWMSVSGGFAFDFYWNYQHKENIFKFRPQLMLGLTFCLP